jgi:aldehyde:ferredoxin oxidoreductase
MTGLRAFFHAYSPLKASKAGAPAPMWSAGSGKFGTKLRYLNVDEVLFTGRAPEPTMLRITAGPEFEFLPASEFTGQKVNARMKALHERYPEAHFALIGPAGENYEKVRYAAIALSTVNQLRSGDSKSRFCGRGGFGGVMGSKNLMGIIADTPDAKRKKSSPIILELNKEVARGKGSQRFRERGTWANYEALNPVHAVPEMNFVPTGTEASFGLHKPMVEQGPYVVKDEACYRCGIKCHKNVYDKNEDGKAGRFRAKLDYEPLNLLSSNLGIYDIDSACDLVEMVDELCMDSISLGVSLAYAMEYNKRHPDAPIAGGLSYGDAEAAARVITEIGTGQLELIGQGSKRAAEELGEPGYAMHCKGVEFPAYLPQTNPGYPWAVAGGHMSMNTYLLLLYKKETGMDYWVDAIAKWGWLAIRDDLIGVCKFSGMNDQQLLDAIEAISGLKVEKPDLKRAVLRTQLRGLRMEKQQGFTDADYDMPAEVHQQYPQIELPHFNTKEFHGELKQKVNARFDELMVAEGL